MNFSFKNFCNTPLQTHPSIMELNIQSYQFKAILIGVVRHAVKTSAGTSGCIGKSSSGWQAAIWMQSFNVDNAEPFSCVLHLCCKIEKFHSMCFVHQARTYKNISSHTQPGPAAANPQQAWHLLLISTTNTATIALPKMASIFRIA